MERPTKSFLPKYARIIYVSVTMILCTTLWICGVVIAHNSPSYFGYSCNYDEIVENCLAQQNLSLKDYQQQRNIYEVKVKAFEYILSLPQWSFFDNNQTAKEMIDSFEMTKASFLTMNSTFFNCFQDKSTIINAQLATFCPHYYKLSAKQVLVGSTGSFVIPIIPYLFLMIILSPLPELKSKNIIKKLCFIIKVRWEDQDCMFMHEMATLFFVTHFLLLIFDWLFICVYKVSSNYCTVSYLRSYLKP